MKKYAWIIGISFCVGAPLSIACQPVPAEDGADDDDGATEGGAGLGGDDVGTREAQLCQRAAECLYLEAGYTVGDCTDIVESCTDDLLTSAHADWNGWADECLGLENCMNFGACYRSIDVCTLYVEVEVDAESSEPPSDGGEESSGSGTPDPTGAGSGGCGPDAQACVDEETIGVCQGGSFYAYDCLEACVAGGYSESFGCGWDPVAEQDMCLCA